MGKGLIGMSSRRNGGENLERSESSYLFKESFTLDKQNNGTGVQRGIWEIFQDIFVDRKNTVGLR